MEQYLKDQLKELHLIIQRANIKYGTLAIKRDQAIYKLTDALKYIDKDTKEAKRLINSAIHNLDSEG